jgi:hypothetical protein
MQPIEDLPCVRGELAADAWVVGAVVATTGVAHEVHEEPGSPPRGLCSSLDDERKRPYAALRRPRITHTWLVNAAILRRRLDGASRCLPGVARQQPVLANWRTRARSSSSVSRRSIHRRTNRIVC